MPEDCRYMRVRLQIEYSRLLDWCEVAGLAVLTDGQDLPECLRADKLTLIAVLTEISVSTKNLAKVRGKYVEFKSSEDTTSENAATEMDLLEEFSHVAVPYEKEPGKGNQIRSRNSIARRASMASNLVKNPKRLKWVAFDRDVFLKFLGRLAELNDHLQELMHGHQARALEIATQKTYLEMVQMRASVEELTHLVTAAMLLQEHDGVASASASYRHRNQNALASLARFKSLNASHGISDHGHSSGPKKTTISSQLHYSQIEYDEDATSATTSDIRIRSEGNLTSSDDTKQHVWIEWKSYDTKYDRSLDQHVPVPKHLKRIKDLVSLLQSEKPMEFCAPHCQR